MAFIFEELDAQDTALGTISLRKRAEPRLGGKILYEVKLGDEFLMSSLFTEAEIQLSKLGLKALKSKGFTEKLGVVVGGLGLGYTALAALEDQAVEDLCVVELMPAVIDWHKRGILPIGDIVATSPKSSIQNADFFQLATSKNGFYPNNPSRTPHAVLLDIDHSPDFWLDPSNSTFYTPESLSLFAGNIREGGVFGLWSDEQPDDKFTQTLGSAFESVETHLIEFANPLSGGVSANTVYLAFR